MNCKCNNNFHNIGMGGRFNKLAGYELNRYTEKPLRITANGSLYADNNDILDSRMQIRFVMNL